MVALSTLESKNYDKVLNWKRHAVFTETDMPIAERDPIVASEFGDLKVTQIRQPQKRLTDKEVAQSIAEYQNGMTTYQLAEKYGCDRQTMSAVLKRNGVHVTKCKASKRIDDEKVIAMYADMFTSEQIARKFGISPQVVLQCLRSNGVTIRNRWDYEKQFF